MISKLEGILARYEKLNELISDPSVLSDMETWKKYAKERSDIEETAQKYSEYKKIETDMKNAEKSLETETDKEMKDLLEEEYYDCKKKLAEIGRAHV